MWKIMVMVQGLKSCAIAPNKTFRPSMGCGTHLKPSFGWDEGTGGPAGRGRHTAGASRLPALRTPAGSRRAAALLGYLHLRQQQSCAVAARFTFYPLIKESAFVGYTIICGP